MTLNHTDRHDGTAPGSLLTHEALALVFCGNNPLDLRTATNGIAVASVKSSKRSPSAAKFRLCLLRRRRSSKGCAAASHACNFARPSWRPALEHRPGLRLRAGRGGRGCGWRRRCRGCRGLGALDHCSESLQNTFCDPKLQG